MTTRSRGMMMLALCAGIGCSTTVFAQPGIDPAAAPQNPAASSAAAMKLTVNDPRIGKALHEDKGEWKWVIPPVKMKGAFDDHDPIGVITGRLIPADCALNWTDPDTHKLFCFSTATSLNFFLDAPKTNEAKAEKSWRALKNTAS